MCENKGMCKGLTADISELGADDQMRAWHEEVSDVSHTPIQEAVRRCPR